MSSKPHNNFDFLRMLAATLVMLSHAYQISYGEKISDISIANKAHAEPLLRLSGGQLTLGHLSVLIFFVISGYLITLSQDRSPSAWAFLKNRGLRIFPGLAVVILFTVLVIGAVSTSLPPGEYFASAATWRYLTNISMDSTVGTLPGVFADTPLPAVVNGSLWTLKYEFACYLVVCSLGVVGLIGKKSAVMLFCLSFAEVLVARNTGHPLIYFLMFFSMGMILYVNRDNLPLRGKFAAAAGFFLLLAVVFGSKLSPKAFVLAFGLLGGYVILYLAFAPWLKMSSFARYGDFSYGLYIYAFPIQQLVGHYLRGHQEWYWNFLISFPLTLACAYCSWHWIEKKALAMKGKRKPVVETARV